jgi:hypothetical protein
MDMQEDSVTVSLNSLRRVQEDRVERELEEERRAREAAEAERRRLHQAELAARMEVNERLREQIAELQARVRTAAAAAAVAVPVAVAEPVTVTVTVPVAARAPWVLATVAMMLSAVLFVLLLSHPRVVEHIAEHLDVVPVPIPVTLVQHAPAPVPAPAPAPAPAPKKAQPAPYHYHSVDVCPPTSTDPLCGLNR